MRSIRTKISIITITAVVLTMAVATVIGIYAVRRIGKDSSNQMLYLLCETGEKNLNSYFQSVEQSVEMVSIFAESDLEGLDPSELPEHMERVFSVFERAAYQTDGVLTFYYRIDPEFSDEVDGFWYIERGDYGFAEHTVTDISSYDTSSTSDIIWFTVPKNTGNSIWLPPYVTENLNARVLSYNAPIYQDGRFVGVIGMEIDYSTMADQVNNISLYDHGYAFITDSYGRLIYHPYMDVTTLSDDERPMSPVGLSGDNKVVTYEYDGVLKLAVRMTLSNGMKLNVCVPESEIDGNWQALTVITLMVSAVLLIVFIILSMYISGKISRPLTELTEAAEKVNDGDYDVELNHNANDEVGVLTNAFRKLIGNLKEYIGNLNELNRNLAEDNLSLEAATIRDSLTGVKNRFALRRDYNKYVETDIHIMMLDIDDFKSVNDTFGHSVGDYLLKNVGSSLIDQFGTNYCYRYGGDEFLVVVPDMTEDDFKGKIISLEKQLEMIKLEDKAFPVHFSAGYVYGHTYLDDDLRLMLRQADEHLYKAKGNGKNSFIGDAYDRLSAETIKKKEEESFRKG